ncbi:unnamed protein product [marine sediment metagenome]|uniref:Uncharacterized protein n=1 Tax=marine sediment metagenome TaxID=412755 RepID=X1S567_9ZZZZ
MKKAQNFYKYRLWLSDLDHNLLNDRQKRELRWFLAWGPKGCDSYNYKLQEEFPVSIRTIQRDLRLLEYHHFIVRAKGWAELARGKFVRRLRDRRIITIPYPTKAAWMRAAIRQLLAQVGDKNVTLQLRRGKTPTWLQRKALLNSTGEKGGLSQGKNVP